MINKRSRIHIHREKIASDKIILMLMITGELSFLSHLRFLVALSILQMLFTSMFLRALVPEEYV